MAQWDPAKNICTIATNIIPRFYAADSMLMFEFDEDRNSVHTGVDGEGRHIENKNRSGVFHLYLADYSPTNDLLTALEATNQSFPISVVDKSTKQGRFFGGSCKVKKVPNFDKKKETSENEWTFTVIRGDVKHSGDKDYTVEAGQ